MALAMPPVMYWFDLQENRKGILKSVGALEHTEVLNGEDVLRFSTLSVPDKYDRLLWRDPEDGRWREHVVVTASQGLSGLCNVRAESSLVDLKAAYHEETHLVEKRVLEAFEAVLANTAWRVVQNDHSDSRYNFVFYHMSAYDAFFQLFERHTRTEAEPVITVENDRVVSREVLCKYRLGKGRGLRFQDGKNLHLCRKAISSAELFTALYGWGAALPITDEEGNYTGGYTRRMGFADCVWNESGLPWTGDDEARDQYGLWNVDRSEKLHRFGDVIFPGEESNVTLYGRTKTRLATVSQPRFSYSVEGALPAGFVVGLGDPVSISSSRHAERVNYQTRVRKRVRTIGDEVRCKVSLGDPLTWLWNRNLGYGE